jgi:predicted metalloprotease with PDZ domain
MMQGRGWWWVVRVPGTFAWCCAWSAAPVAAQTTSYEVDLLDRADDRFKVVATLEALDAADSIFQFAATAPGTYQIMDIGRYVERFAAFDANGREVPTAKVSTNQWRLSDPARVRTVRYAIAETWDTPVEEHVPYLMCGTSIEADNVLVSPHAVFGYPARRQDLPVRVRFKRPDAWRVGSALVPDADGWYHAVDYDQLVDSPFLMGSTLTEATLTVGDVPVEVWVYSKTGKIQATQLLTSMRAMLTSAGEFLHGLPVDRYAFLWHFEDTSMGAWEHSYSSEYVLAEPQMWTPAVGGNLTDIAAHEFFHVMTPLNIHSEIIQHFDFEHPTPSQHLWLYEGVTEWASDAMQLRSDLVQLPVYLDKQIEKIVIDRAYFDPNYSLRELALTSYTDAGQRQYGNIYMRGALVAGLLDIRLLELSGGRRGLRELILELASEYGKDRPFPENGFFDIVTAMTYPEIGDFFHRYVESAEPLPFAEYYAKLGIRFVDGDHPHFEIMPDATPSQVALREAWLRGRPAA